MTTSLLIFKIHKLVNNNCCDIRLFLIQFLIHFILEKLRSHVTELIEIVSAILNDLFMPGKTFFIFLIHFSQIINSVL